MGHKAHFLPHQILEQANLCLNGMGEGALRAAVFMRAHVRQFRAGFRVSMGIIGDHGVYKPARFIVPDSNEKTRISAGFLLGTPKGI